MMLTSLKYHMKTQKIIIGVIGLDINQNRLTGINNGSRRNGSVIKNQSIISYGNTP
ncbi:hypothetical protein Pan54_03210 [Rubinisphaera italica]|uniref:Uncharacterized protein n=1 Tax=Rubinisphaera italica TaxID=2527969 RepID=A0A5C5XBG1_9PLAN|nr:hypothetical protein Pan54_03210 [Rubinisphaera italica]